jgi:hypothetical protein
MTKAKRVKVDIVLIDIIRFSRLSADNQLEIVSFLTKSFRRVIEKMLAHSNIPLEEFIIGFIATGDGFYCLLNQKYRGYGVILGLSFNHFSEQISKKFPYFEGIRIAVDHGEVNALSTYSVMRTSSVMD